MSFFATYFLLLKWAIKNDGMESLILIWPCLWNVWCACFGEFVDLEFNYADNSKCLGMSCCFLFFLYLHFQGKGFPVSPFINMEKSHLWCITCWGETSSSQLLHSDSCSSMGDHLKSVGCCIFFSVKLFYLKICFTLSVYGE